MNHCFMDMIQKLSSSHHRGKVPTSLRPKKAHQVRSRVKSMMIVVFNICDLVHKEFLPLGSAVNAMFYCEVLKRLRESTGANVHTCEKTKNWFLYPLPWPHACSHIAASSIVPDTQNFTIVPLFGWPNVLWVFHFQKWNYDWKGTILICLRRSRQNRWRLSTSFCDFSVHLPKVTLKAAWALGKNAGIAVYILKSTTSKDMEETSSFGKQHFYTQIPQTFG